MPIRLFAAAISTTALLSGAGSVYAMPASSVVGPSVIEKAVVVSKTTVIRRPPPRAMVRKKIIIR